MKMLLDSRIKMRTIYFFTRHSPAVIIMHDSKRITTAPNNIVYDDMPKELKQVKLFDQEKYIIMECIFTDDAITGVTKHLFFEIIRSNK